MNDPLLHRDQPATRAWSWRVMVDSVVCVAAMGCIAIWLWGLQSSGSVDAYSAPHWLQGVTAAALFWFAYPRSWLLARQNLQNAQPPMKLARDIKATILILTLLASLWLPILMMDDLCIWCQGAVHTAHRPWRLLAKAGLGLVVLLIPALVMMWWVGRQVRCSAARDMVCYQCSYDLRSCQAGACPECGHLFAGPAS